MKEPSKDERIAFWKYAYARSSFIEARSYINHLINSAPPLNSPERRLLTIAVLTLYCRPFKQRPQVRLSESLISSEYYDIHNSTIFMRDKVVAHRDLDAPVADWGFLSELRIRRINSELSFETISPSLSDEHAIKILPLIHSLISDMDEHINQFAQTYLLYLPPEDALYTVHLGDVPPHWLQLIPQSV